MTVITAPYRTGPPVTDRSQTRPLSRLAGLLPCLLALAGCSGLQTQDSTSAQIFARNATLTDWQLSGKIGVTSPDSANSAYLNWVQCGRQFEIRINGPLGAGAAMLVSDGNTVSLTENNQPPVSASSPEQLLQQQLGWQLPVSQLSFWVRGIPSPGQKSRATELGFEQSGWLITFPRQTQSDNFILPARAIATRADMKVTLILQQWQLHPDCDAL